MNFPYGALVVSMTVALSGRSLVEGASPYRLITSGTCADFGYRNIYDSNACKAAASQFGKTITWGPHGGYQDVVDGCSLRFDSSLFLNSNGKCDPSHAVGEWTHTGCRCADKQPCLCEVEVAYEVVKSGTCSSAGYANVYDADSCKKAARQVGKTISWGPHGGYQDVVDGCSERFGTSLFLNPNGKCNPSHAVGEWTYTGCECANKQPCLCQLVCPPGNYCPYGGLERKTCPVGYYCPGGVGSDGIKVKCKDYDEYCPRTGMSAPETSCPVSQFGSQCESTVMCLTSRGSCQSASKQNKGPCYNFYGNGVCTKCDKNYAGGICEHNVCRESSLARSIAGSHSNPPSSFDFSFYAAEDLAVSQESETDGDFGVRVKFRPIAFDIKEHRLVINNSDVGISSGAVPECGEDGPAQLASLPLHAINEPVGTKINVCLRGIWKDSRLKLTGGTWGDLATRQNENQRPNPKVCADYSIQFQTRVTFSVRDLYNSVNIEGAVVRYTVDGVAFEGTTDKLGRIGTSIIVPGIANAERAALVIDEVVSFNANNGGDFVRCLSRPQAGRACEDSQQRDLPLQDPIVVEHLNAASQEILIVDKTAVRVAGRVLFEAGTGNDACGIGGATVVVKNANAPDIGDGANILMETTTDGAGDFEVAVPKQTRLKLEIMYNNHTFMGADQSAGDLLSEAGLLVSDATDGLVFRDIATSEVTVTSAVTECMFDIGNYALELELPSCPTIRIPAEPSNGRETFTITVPAHKYRFSLARFDGVAEVADGATIEQRFEHIFPASEDEEFDRRTLDLTNETATVRFIYHPDPVINLEIGEGIFPPETFPSACGDGDGGPTPFDFAVEGNGLVSLKFTFRQAYNQDFCDILPDFSTLTLQSDLGQPLDPCAAVTGGCDLNPTIEEYQGVNLTIARTIVFAGSPVTFGESQEEKSITDYVGSNKISYTLFNPTHFGFLQRPDGKSSVGESRILVLGNKPITKDSLVSFFSEGQDHVPILYLNSPPAGVGISTAQTSTQSVALDLAVTTTTKTFAATDIRIGGGGYVGIKNKGNAYLCVPFVGCSIKIQEGEQTLKTSNSEFDITTKGYSDDIQVEVKSQRLQLTTPKGLWGKYGDMVLLVGTVANFITSTFVSFDVESCRIRETTSIVWGSTTESLLFYSRSDIELEFDKLEQTIRHNEPVVGDPAAPEEARAESSRLVRISENSKKKWSALFAHWEEDRRQARNHKVDLRGLVSGGAQEQALNRVTFGSSELTLKRTVKMSDSSVLDYTSTGSVFSNKEDYDFSLLFGANFIVGPVGGGSFEYTKTTKSLFSTTKQESNSMEVTAYLTENDAGDKLCVDVYESPHSGTFVFEVCGGETSCPHVPGTDAREKFRLNVIEQPTAALQQDSGRIILEVDTFDMASSLDDLDIVLELDARTALFPVRFDIGSASLNQPLEFTLDARKRTPVFILFERLDPNLQSIQISGSVRSRCDSGVRQHFSFAVEWASQCPPVRWGGALSPIDANFKITSVQPNLALTASNPTGTRWRDVDGVNVEVSLWQRPFDSVTEPWMQIPNDLLRTERDPDAESGNFVDREDNAGLATLWLANRKGLFRDGDRYEFELRSMCTVLSNGLPRVVGESRSGPRLGVVDTQGPRIISWSSTPSVNAPTMAFPVANILFNEAVDCSHPSLTAEVSLVGSSSVKSLVYCTGRAQQLHVVLSIESEAEVEEWNGKDAIVDIRGLRDIHGNLYNQDGTVSHRRLLQQNDLVRMNLTVPVLPAFDGTENPWIVPKREEMEMMVKEERDRMLPPGLVVASANIQTNVVSQDDIIAAAAANENSGAMIGGLLGGAVVVLAAIAFAVGFVVRRKKAAKPREEALERKEGTTESSTDEDV